MNQVSLPIPLMRFLRVLTRGRCEFHSPCGIAPGWNALFWGIAEGKHHDARSQSSTLSAEDTRDQHEIMGRSDRDHLPAGTFRDDIGAAAQLLDTGIRAVAPAPHRAADGIYLQRRSLSSDPAEVSRPRKRCDI